MKHEGVVGLVLGGESVTVSPGWYFEFAESHCPVVPHEAEPSIGVQEANNTDVQGCNHRGSRASAGGMPGLATCPKP